MKLLAALALLAPFSTLNAQPVSDVGAIQEAEALRRSLDEDLRRLAMSVAPKDDPAACEECNQGQYMLEACYKVDTSDLEKTQEKAASAPPMECKDSCSVELVQHSFDKLCERRAADAACAAAVAKEKDPSILAQLAKCPACLARLNHESRKNELRAQRKKLDAALGTQRVDEIRAVTAEIRAPKPKK